MPIVPAAIDPGVPPATVERTEIAQHVDISREIVADDQMVRPDRHGADRAGVQHAARRHRGADRDLLEVARQQVVHRPREVVADGDVAVLELVEIEQGVEVRSPDAGHRVIVRGAAEYGRVWRAG